MKLSARNQINGRVLEVRKGTTTAHVRIDIGNGVVITSSITNEAVDDLDSSPENRRQKEFNNRTLSVTRRGDRRSVE